MGDPSIAEAGGIAEPAASRRPGQPGGPGDLWSQPSGGEKTTITRKSSVMWWNLWATPAGT